MTADAMTANRLLVHHGTFAITSAAGDITGGRGETTEGLFIRDARHLSRWLLTADRAAPTLLTSSDEGCVLTPAGTRDQPPTYTLFRRQEVAAGALTEQILLVNNTGNATTVELELDVDADFADQFELRADHRTYERSDAHHTTQDLQASVMFRYRRGNTWTSHTTVTSTPAPHRISPADGTGRVLSWRLALPAHGTADLTLIVQAAPQGIPTRPASPAKARDQEKADTDQFVHARPRPRSLTSWPELARACEQGLSDLARLRIPARGPDGEALQVPAAGIPWFLSLFGRDSLLTSLFALPYRPELASDTLLALAATQGTGYDETRLEQPGKIVHEIRHGELAHFRQVPYGRYYGSIDATPLFLILLESYTSATGDPALARRLEPQARAAVEWIVHDGGLNDHGYLRYTSDAAHGGLAHQNWKDSQGAICFVDGRQAEGPLAVCEIQGYTYDALIRTARLAHSVWNDPNGAAHLNEAAADLKLRFRRDFWMPDQDFPALALDDQGQQVDALASDAGHLLWSGILDHQDAQAVAHRLLQPDFFSGWGIRTLAANQAPYHPLSYHRGGIWPHDNAITVLGMAKNGLAEEASTLARALIQAAALHHWRLPEVMAGYGRNEHPSPVPYPHSCSPQAWAAATPLALLTALRGAPSAISPPHTPAPEESLTSR
jgi:glycogen debranching enzyme